MDWLIENWEFISTSIGTIIGYIVGKEREKRSNKNAKSK